MGHDDIAVLLIKIVGSEWTDEIGKQSGEN